MYMIHEVRQASKIEQLQLLSGWRLLQLQLLTSWIGNFFTAIMQLKPKIVSLLQCAMLSKLKYGITVFYVR